MAVQETAKSLQEVCGVDPGPVCTWLYEQTGSEVLAQLLSRFVGPLVESTVIVVLALLMNRLARRGIDKLIFEAKEDEAPEALTQLRARTGWAFLEGDRTKSARRSQRADALGALGRSLVGALIWSIAGFMILGAFGINLGPLIAGAGVIGLALGFGAQTLVKDFLSGIFMLVEDQYGLGDIVDVGEASGVVEGVSLRTTRVRDVTGTLWHVPNGEIRRVGNKSQQWARALLDVGVAYDTDIDHASAVILAAANEIAEDPEYRHLIQEPPEIWGVEMLGASSMDIRLVVQTVPGEQWGVMRALRRRIKQRLDEEGIEIPFPQRTVWMRAESDA